jgi:serine/threonine protein kinase
MLKLRSSVASRSVASRCQIDLLFATTAAKNLKKNPQPIPGYQMIRVLGQGGMGSVMLARSVKDGMPVAIKTLLPEVAVSEQSLKRFIREIEVAATLQHPNIVSYIEHGTHNGIVYLSANTSAEWTPPNSPNIAAEN